MSEIVLENKVEKRKISNEGIARLEVPIKRILEQILPSIEAGEYGLIIGDDTSGRIPALIISHFVGEIYKRKGHHPAPTIFLAGGRHLSSSEKEPKKNKIKEYLKHRSFEPISHNKILYVTEAIKTGQGIEMVIEALREYGFAYDIVTTYLADTSEKHISSLEDKFKGNLFVGSGDFNDITGVYGIRHMAGVEKMPRELFAQPFKKGERGEDQEHTQERISTSRADANVVLESLLNWYESQKQNV